jgi:hypothetical protein
MELSGLWIAIILIFGLVAIAGTSIASVAFSKANKNKVGPAGPAGPRGAAGEVAADGADGASSEAKTTVTAADVVVAGASITLTNIQASKQVALLPDGTTSGHIAHVLMQLTAAAAVTNLGTLTAAYRPTTTTVVPCTITTVGTAKAGHVSIATSGVMTLTPSAALAAADVVALMFQVITA